MDNKKWTALVSVLLIAGIVASAIFVQQRNEARQLLRLSHDQISDLERRNSELSESLENQNIRLSEEMDLVEKKQAALKTAEIQMTELKSLLSRKQAELNTVQSQLQQADSETASLQQQLDSTEEKITYLASKSNQLEDERKILESHIEDMEGKDAKRRTTITMLERQVEERDEKISAFDKEIQILNHTIARLRNQIQKFITLVPELEERLELSLNKYQVVQENLTQAKARKAELEAQRKVMRETYEALVDGLKQQIDSQEASIEEYREKLKVTFVDRILFGFSQVRISPEGKAALNELVKVLANVPEGKISIAGHADNIPVAEKFQYRFPSNWELSSARAAAVARYLLENGNLEPSRIEVVGSSYYQPVADNDTETGRAKNRRVEIIIMSER